MRRKKIIETISRKIKISAAIKKRERRKEQKSDLEVKDCGAQV